MNSTTASPFKAGFGLAYARSLVSLKCSNAWNRGTLQEAAVINVVCGPLDNPVPLYSHQLLVHKYTGSSTSYYQDKHAPLPGLLACYSLKLYLK